MNAPLVCLMTVLSAAAADGETTLIYAPSEHFAQAIRGQTPRYEELPSSPGTVPRTYSTPGVPASPYSTTPASPQLLAPGSGGMTPFRPGQPAGPYDPFLVQPGSPAPYGMPVSPYGGSIAGPSAIGACGPTPYRFGWLHRYEAGFIEAGDVEGGYGELQITEFDAEWRYVSPLSLGWIFSQAAEFGVRWWDGPETSPLFPGFGLPADVYRFGWDVAVTTPPNGPWVIEFGFNPSINTDFERELTNRGVNYDARIIGLYRASPYLSLVIGVQYWDRVDDIFVPNVGAIWTPDDRWEWRLVFPDPRVSLFLGHEGGYAKWLYVRGEYHVESYEIEFEPIGRRGAIQLEDWRVLAGVKLDGPVSWFLEAGVVFGRELDFRRGPPDLEVDDSFIVRAGVQY